MTQTASRVPFALKLVYTAYVAAYLAVLLPISFFLPPPPTRNPGLMPVNINYVWGMSDYAAQTWAPPYVWFAGQLIGLPLLAYLPTHFVPARVMPKAQ
ncbi:MAG: hypothetical protein WBD95_19265 [Xanthobacteraceae bacterium]